MTSFDVNIDHDTAPQFERGLNDHISIVPVSQGAHLIQNEPAGENRLIPGFGMAMELTTFLHYIALLVLSHFHQTLHPCLLWSMEPPRFILDG